MCKKTFLFLGYFLIFHSIEVGAQLKNFQARFSARAVEEHVFAGGGLGFEHFINDNFTFSLNVDYMYRQHSVQGVLPSGQAFLRQDFGNSLYFEPQLRYYFKYLFDGFYLATDIGFLPINVNSYSRVNLSETAVKTTSTSASSANLLLGLRLGYFYYINQRWGVDASISGNYMMSSHLSNNFIYGGRLGVAYMFF
ncbi:MAG: DUF3575 domain-containing protein [Chitinophagales bacterium]|jgi:hypothetical protein|nr:DUF3575 domain-containing protein [Chitinophagales bacterium]